MNTLQTDRPQYANTHEVERAIADFWGQKQIYLDKVTWCNNHIEELQKLLKQMKQQE